MGIKHFFMYLRDNFTDDLYYLNRVDDFTHVTDSTIDNLLLDMNGIFHTCAQKIYQYGNTQPKSFFRRPVKATLKKQQEFFQEVCNTIDFLLSKVKPKKRLVMCVDGTAPLGKAIQQRQRRFISAKSRDENAGTFDSTCISPGTKMMDYLTKYIDWYIRKKMSEDDPNWNLEVVFSNEKAPGEGEHNLISWIRKYGNQKESYCFHGMDADLIMLALGTQLEKVWILRDDVMSGDFYVIDVGHLHISLSEKLKWDSDKYEFSSKRAIHDFILICFFVGNDFLPHVPCVEIIEGSIDLMISVYKEVCTSFGHLTRNNGRMKFRRRAFGKFLSTISMYEKEFLLKKMEHKDRFFQDELLERNIVDEDIDMENYRYEYYMENVSEDKNFVNITSFCHEYMAGIDWVINYYIYGVPSWTWNFPYHYAPFAYDLAKHLKTFRFPVYTPNYNGTKPTVPFIQLLSILPPKSAYLLPSPLNTLLLNNPLNDYCPEDFKIDCSGKRQEWEGVVLLPVLDYNTVEKEYSKYVKEIDDKERRRNILGKTFVYTKNSSSKLFHSYYGDIQCKVSLRNIEL